VVILGIDVGGSGIKAAPVETRIGEATAERHRVPTPQPATPEAVAEAVCDLVRHFDWRGPIGCALPSVVRDGRTLTAANLDPAWIGCDARALLVGSTDCPVHVLNDGDAAGLAEVRFGAARERSGTVLVLTIGTGIGSALFYDGALVPNTELGHLEVGGVEAEQLASDRVRRKKDLGWTEWAGRLERCLETYHALLWPELIVLGGGVIKKKDRFLHLLRVEGTEVVAAELGRDAGLVGAAIFAGDEAPSHLEAELSPPPPGEM
jgi:polyphosphate glucokinase